MIDFKALLKALDEIGYAGPFNYETGRGTADAAECISAIEENFVKMKELL